MLKKISDNNNNKIASNSSSSTPPRLPFSGSLCAGAIAATAAVFCTNPLDVVRTRLQSSHQTSSLHGGRSLLESIRSMINEGFRKGLMRGVGPNLLAALPSRSFYLSLYSEFKRNFEIYTPVTNANHQHIIHGSSAALSVVILSFTMNPLFVIRTRCQLASTSATGTAFAVTSNILKTEGIGGFFNGLFVGMFGKMFEGALYFAIYEHLKKLAHCDSSSSSSVHSRIIKNDSSNNSSSSSSGNNNICNIGSSGRSSSSSSASSSSSSSSSSTTTAGLVLGLQFFSTSMVAKLISALIAYPHMVVVTYLREVNPVSGKHDFKGSFLTTKRIFKTDGFRGFYYGLFPHLCRVLPNTGVTFTVYELLVRWWAPYFNTTTTADDKAGKTALT